MAFLKIQVLVFRCLVASLFCMSLFSCQGSKKEKETSQPTLMGQPQEDGRHRAVVPASFTAATVRQLRHQLDSVFTYLHKYRGFNGTVLVSKYDQVIYKGAFGFADFYYKDSLTTQTAFQLASVSKQFTAMAIMMLQEQGKLHYDDSVQQYLPVFPYKGITIRQLLTHRSGLSNYTYFSDRLWPDLHVPITNADVLNLMAQHQPPVYYPPNTHFDYSNTGYMLLALIVEQVSGMPFSVFLQKHIFEPLQMANSFTFDEKRINQRGRVATGHNRNRRKRTTDYLDTVLGDKGVYSTVEDLFKWDQALYTQKLVKHTTLKEAFTGTRQDKRRKKEDYGFGWRITQAVSGDTVVFHGGLWHGFATYLMRNPKDHSAIIVLSNLPNGSVRYIRDIQRFLYPPPASPIQTVSTSQSNSGDSEAGSGQP